MAKQHLNPLVSAHLPNRWRVLEDETNIRFLGEEGGFPGCADMGASLII